MSRGEPVKGGRAVGGRCARWRLLVDGGCRGADNMARDVALLEAVASGAAAPTLRLYGWAPPCLSLGRHQGREAADLEACARLGVDVVRRPTGGRALLHHLELTYAVVAPLGAGPIPGRLQEAYRTICVALVRGLGALGVTAELAGDEVNLSLPGPRSVTPCFRAPAGGEIVVGGRKLVGSAMRSHRDAILQHGAILLGWDSALQAASMGLGDDRALRGSVTTLGDELGRAPEAGELEDALCRAVVAELGIELEAGGWEGAELEAAAAARARFAILETPATVGSAR